MGSTGYSARGQHDSSAIHSEIKGKQRLIPKRSGTIMALTEGNLQELWMVYLLSAWDIEMDCRTKCFFVFNEWALHQKIWTI